MDETTTHKFGHPKKKKKKGFNYSKNSTVKFYIYTVMRSKDANGISNSVNSDETTVGLQCLSRPV